MLLTATIGLAAPAYATDRSGRLSVDGRERAYTVHLPDGLSPPGGYPVILAFHGGGMQGRQMERLTRLDQIANIRRFIAVYPDGINKHWNDGRTTIRDPQDDVGFVAALIARLNTDYL
ncbi:PHB depolymerase family esterase [Acetobacter sp. DsW_063]|uniref:alpha/beta hydrolase family esterase n=1 Tax=Acetobacter sp. DsW_063 TaxID=1514894 RepID=UPI000A37F0FA|nr:hypothetical protein [Acetobacter sp. DsW_063]OUJ12168.1 hypothetical protein HK28_03915 [Acetobacter sp. DsW_063]